MKLKLIVTGIVVEEGCIIPRWYGQAYRNFDRDQYIYYVFPINWFVWAWKNHIRYWCRYPPKDKELAKAYQAGLTSAWKHLDKPQAVRFWEN